MKQIFKTILITLSILIVVGAISIGGLLSWYGYKTSDGYIDKITKEAVKSNNPLLCNKIQPVFMGSDGRPGCYNQVAIQNKNIGACVAFGPSCYSAYFQYYIDEERSACQKAAENIEGIKAEIKGRPEITIEQIQQSELHWCSLTYDTVRKIK